jgi:hypothetical protein
MFIGPQIPPALWALQMEILESSRSRQQFNCKESYSMSMK